MALETGLNVYTQNGLHQPFFSVREPSDVISEPYERAETLLPDNAGIKLLLGVKLLERGDYCQAARKFRQAIVICKYEPWSYLLLSAALTSNREFDEAIEAYREFLNLRPESDARALRDRSIKLDPAQVAILNRLAETMVESGVGEQVVSLYKEAVEYDVENALMHGGLGELLFEVGRTEEAIRAYETAIMMEPEFEGLKAMFVRRLANLGIPSSGG